MPSKSKIKGSGWEREIAKYLTDTYGLSFIRNNSGSGAYIGGKNNVRKTTLSESQIRHSKGDIVPPESWPRFNAEAKFYDDIPWHQLVESCPQLESWLQQLLTVADTGDVNILFMKFNRKGRYVAVQVNHLPWNSNCSHIRYSSSASGDWMIFSWENFFKLNRDHLKTNSEQFTVSIINPSLANNLV